MFLPSRRPAVAAISRRPLAIHFVAIGIVGCLSLNSTAVFAQRELTDIPKPDPVKEVAAMRIDPAAAVNLYASDPVIRKPVQMNFDAAGRLWVASSESYPQITPGTEPNDKIVVLQDSDGDGVAETSTVFADGLLIPTAVLPDGLHAAYVGEGPHLLHLSDTDGDGRADRRRIVLSGFGTEDTHHLLHTLRWGPDGCVYFNQSIYIHSHIDTPDGTRRLDGGGIWRYRPETGQLDVFCKGFINPWGHVFDSDGESFVTDGAFFEGINHAFPGAVFVTSPGATRWLGGLNPGSPKHCGLEILSGKHIPPDWAGDLITNDFRSHRVCRFTVRPESAGFVSRQQPELIVSDHVAFRPVDVRMGPDGSILVADWYNPIIQHGEVDFRDPRRDTLHGRIWRISFPDRAPDPWPNFASLSLDALLECLENDSLTQRQFAREWLWTILRRESGGQTNGQASDAWSVVDRWVDESIDENQQLHRSRERQWLREALDQQSAMIPIVDVSDNPHSDDGQIVSPGIVRSHIRAVLQQSTLAPSRSGVWRDRLAGQLAVWADSDDPAVIREVIVGCGLVANDSATRTLHQMVSRRMSRSEGLNRQDHPALDFAIHAAMRATADVWVSTAVDVADAADAVEGLRSVWASSPRTLVRAVADADRDDATALLHSIVTRVIAGEDAAWSVDDLTAGASRIAARAAAAPVGAMVTQLLNRETDLPLPTRLAAIEAMLQSSADRKDFQPVGVSSAMAEFGRRTDLGDSQDAWLAIVAGATTAWRIDSGTELLLNGLATDAVDTSTRLRVIDALASVPDPAARRAIQELVAGDHRPDRDAAIGALVRQRPGDAVAAVLQTLSGDASAEQAGTWIAALMTRKRPAEKLVDGLRSIELSADTARGLLRGVRSAGGNADLEAAIRQSGRLSTASWTWSLEFRDEILTLASTSGSAERGESIYRRAALQCIACHGIGPGGGVVGPNLVSLGGSSQPDYVLQSLIQPSEKLKEGYSTRKILTDDGEVITGIAIGQTDESIRLRLANGDETSVDVDAIVDDQPGQSLMPAGLVDDLTKSELADLMAFLSALGKNRDYTVSTDSIVRQLQTLVYTDEANRRLNRTSTDAVAKTDPILKWRGQTTRVNGAIPLAELDGFQQHRETPKTSFIRFEVQTFGKLGLRLWNADGEASFAGVEAWLDGQPIPTWRLADESFPAGRHEVVLSLNRDLLADTITLGLGDQATTATLTQEELP